MSLKIGNEKIGNYRWVICALLFFATTLNYLDRSIISLLKDELSQNFSWSESDYSFIVICFQISYAIGLLGFGYVIDRFGTKKGYSLSVFFWSLATVFHGFALGTMSFAAARAMLGLSEAGNFPAANKAISEWFPQKERAFATGIYNSGSNIGAISTPILIPILLLYFGWESAFYLAGSLGIIWLILWCFFYDSPSQCKRVSKSELEYINSDTKDAVEENATPHKTYSWFKLLTYKQTWACFVSRFFTDPVWWFFLFWLPAYLKSEYGLIGMEISLPLIVVYTSASIGSIMGGWFPKYLIDRGLSPRKARSMSLLLYAILPLMVLFVQFFGAIDMWYAVLIISLACAAHCAWAANVFAFVSDMFPKQTVASVTGISGMAGAVGGILIAYLAGILFDHYSLLGDISIGYGIMFTICALAYILSWGLMQILLYKCDKIEDL